VASLMMATGARPSASVALKARPCAMTMPSVSK
jgi:hypothetical protein